MTYNIEVPTQDSLRAMREALREVVRRQGDNPLPELVALLASLDDARVYETKIEDFYFGPKRGYTT